MRVFLDMVTNTTANPQWYDVKGEPPLALVQGYRLAVSLRRRR